MKEKHNTHPVMDAHVLIFPLPLQGPINSMLKLAELLCLRQINVTVVITQHIQRRLFDSSAIQTYMETNYGGAFRFESIPDGLSEEHPRTIREFSALLASLSAVAPPILQQMVSVREISCIVAEGIFSFASDIAGEIGVPLFYFDTYSACALWANMCLPQLIQAGELPFKGFCLSHFLPIFRFSNSQRI